MLQTVIVILVVAAAAFFMVRRFYKSVQKENSSTCGCGCNGCSPNEKEGCTDIEDIKS